MKSGLEWNGIEIPISSRDPSNVFYKINSSTDPVAFIFSKPFIARPGSQWYYSNGDDVLPGEVIRDASGLSLDIFAEQHLFAHMGIPYDEATNERHALSKNSTLPEDTG